MQVCVKVIHDTAIITVNILDVVEPSAPDIDSAVIYDGNRNGIEVCGALVG